MARDDSMYDYLRPSDRDYELNEYSLICTVCSEDTEGAEPLYDAVNGNICLHTVKKRYPKEVRDRFVKELNPLVIESVKVFDESNLQGFAGEISYNEGTLTETKRLKSSRIVVDGEKIIGGLVFGKFSIDKEDYTKEEKKCIFLPLGGEPRETDYIYKLTVYGSDGEEDEHICRIYSSLKHG